MKVQELAGLLSTLGITNDTVVIVNTGLHHNKPMPLKASFVIFCPKRKEAHLFFGGGRDSASFQLFFLNSTLGGTPPKNDELNDVNNSKKN